MLAQGHTGEVVVQKTPVHLLLVDRIRRIFPRAAPVLIERMVAILWHLLSTWAETRMHGGRGHLILSRLRQYDAEYETQSVRIGLMKTFDISPKYFTGIIEIEDVVANKGFSIEVTEHES